AWTTPPRQGKPTARAALSRPRLRADLTPLRTSRDFRLLYASRTVTALGTDATEVALLVQARQLTGSTVAVGLLGAVELLPLVVFGLYGGVLADRFGRRRLVVAGEARRRRLIVACEAGLACCAALLMLNALVPHPAVWPLYVATALMMAMAALQRPSLEASMQACRRVPAQRARTQRPRGQRSRRSRAGRPSARRRCARCRCAPCRCRPRQCQPHPPAGHLAWRIRRTRPRRRVRATGRHRLARPGRRDGRGCRRPVGHPVHGGGWLPGRPRLRPHRAARRPAPYRAGGPAPGRSQNPAPRRGLDLHDHAARRSQLRARQRNTRLPAIARPAPSGRDPPADLQLPGLPAPRCRL